MTGIDVRVDRAPASASRCRGARRGAAGALLAALVWCASGPASAQPTVTDPSLAVDVVATQLGAPTSIAFLGDGDALFLEKASGRVRRLLNGVVQPDPVLDVAVNNNNESGLLGIAINRESPPNVFLYYTEVDDPDGNGIPDAGTLLGNNVYRFTWNAQTAKLENKQLLLSLPVAANQSHNGGVLVLGPTPVASPTPQTGDGRPLFVVIGDTNRNGQLENNPAGPLPDDTGVIFRLQQDGSAAPGNPFTPYCSQTTAMTCPDGTGCPGGEVCVTQVARYYGYGVRNSFGLAIDPVTGALWETENGPGNYDEINRVNAGFNSGWVPIMGPDARSAAGVDNLFHMPGAGVTFSDPEFSWLSPVAVTGILFPHHSVLGPAYDAVALVGDFNNGQLYRFPLNAARDGFDLADIAGLEDLVADSAAERDLVRIGFGFGGITDLEQAPDGSIYIVSIRAGAIYRLRAAVAATPSVSPTVTPTVTPSLTPTPYTVSGILRYFVEDRPIPAATVDATGGAAMAFATGVDGVYSAAPLAQTDWALTPRKTGGTNLAISALDATFILQFVADPAMRPFSPVQLLACDTTADGGCTALDATRILQYVAGDTTPFAAASVCGSDWLFTPQPSEVPNQTASPPTLMNEMCEKGRITYTPLVGSAATQNYIGVIIGDVTGNWSP